VWIVDVWADVAVGIVVVVGIVVEEVGNVLMFVV
jgi:hypothetical protein